MNLDGYTLIEKWGQDYGVEGGIYKNNLDDDYTIIFPSRHNRERNHAFYISHSDLNLIKTYIVECYDQFWDSLI